MEVPGQSCLWIPKYLVYVWSVFSCRLQHLRDVTRIPYLVSVLQMVCTPSHTVPYQQRHPSGERFLVWESEPVSFDLATPHRNVTIKGLVE